jgi:hypothetical protein
MWSFVPAVLAVLLCLGLPASEAEAQEAVPPAVKQQMEQTRAELMDWLGSLDRPAFPPDKCLARDEIVLKNGTKLTGKVLDYGPWLCLIDAKGRSIITRQTMQKLTMSWGATPPAKPAMPDLDVTYIERLPRYRSNHGSVGYDPKEKGVYLKRPNDDPLWPPKGTEATFKAHVVNIQDKRPGLVKVPRTGEAYGEPVTLVETKDQPRDVTSDAAGRIYLASAGEPSLIVVDAAGNAIARLGAWHEQSLTGITGMVADHRGLLNCAMGDRGQIIRIPISEIANPKK